MGEPIRLWDKDGVLWVTYSPSAARAAVEAGTHTLEQPVKPNDTQEVAEAAQKYAAAFGVTVEHARMLIDDVSQPVTSDDTQAVAVVPPKRKRERHDGGVL